MKKNMIAVILSIVIAIGSVGAIPVFAVETTAQEAVAIGSGTCGESAVWTLTGTEGDLTLTISGSGDMENFSWMGTPWKSYRGIKACVIEDGITSIGDCAFRYTEISSISLPDSITSIGDYAFYGCYYLPNITIPNNVTSIGKYAFYDCESLKSVSISGKVRSIGDYAFALCATTDISGTDHLLEVNYAGSEDEWNSISIGPNNTGLLNANIIFSSHNHIWNEEYSIDKEATCTEEGSESIHCSTCGKINESTVRIIPKKDHSYGDWIVTKEPLCTEEGSREKHCIYNCGNKITEVIPATGHIWNEEYTVDVEASDTEEGSESIHCSVCDAIDETTIRAIPKKEAGTSGTCGENATWTLTGTEDDLTLTISGSGEMYDFSTASIPWASERSKIKTVIVENGVTALGSYAFYGCENVRWIEIPDSVTTIGEYAFAECDRLDDITIPDSVTSIGEYAFLNCIGLTEIDIPMGIDSIPAFIFSNCQNLSHVIIHENIKKIDAFAFRACKSLTSLYIPDAVEEIAEISENPFSEIPDICLSVSKDSCAETYAKDNRLDYIIVCIDHKWGEEYVVDKEATCIEEGRESIHCTICDVIREGSTRVIEKTDHAYGEWETVNAATCTETGLQKKTCTVCGDEITEEIPATGHIWNTEYTVDKEPTATEEGLESIHCSVCDSVKEGSETVIPQILKPMTMLMISEPEEKTYTGSEITQEIVVIDGDKILVEGIDYTVEYTGNIYPGTATITIEGKGDYAGTITKQFKINQLATPALSSVTAVDSGTGITLAWNAVAGANKYRIYRKAGASSWRALAMTTSTSYTDKNVSAGTKYTYTIRCIADDEKTYVSGYNATGMAITYAATPTLGTLSNQASGIKITWNKATGAVKYRVFKKTGTGDWKTLVDTTSLSYVDKYVSTGTNYTYTVRCITSDGTAYTSGFNSTGKYTVFSARPTISSVSSPNAGQLTVQWSNVSNITGCQIQCSQSSTFAKGNKTVTVESATQVTKTISSLTSKKKYYVRMRTYKTVGGKNYYSTWSTVRSVTVK